MKRIPNLLIILFGLTVFISGLSGCKTNNNLNCPNLANAKKTHAPLFTLSHHNDHRDKNVKPTVQNVNSGASQNSTVLASAASDMRFKIKMPNSVAGQLENDNELEEMNKVLATYSDGKVGLQKNDKGKLILRAHSIKDIFKLAQNVNRSEALYKKQYREKGSGDASGAAIASVVLGPISFLFAFFPFICILAIPIALSAIITGAIGLRSHRRRLAIIGLIFGILGLILSIIFTWFWMSFMILLLLL